MIETLSSMTEDAIEFTREVTTRWSSRLTGSQDCLACGDYLKLTLSEFCDQTETQEFDVRPGSFLGYIRINVVLFLIAVVALWLDQRLLAATVSTFAIVVLVLQFFVYWEFVDLLFPSKTGQNVWGVIEPKGDVKQQVFVTAHHDSAHVFNFLQNNSRWYMAKVMAGMVALFVIVVVTWILLLGQWTGFELGWLASSAKWGFTAWIPFVMLLWFFYSSEGTPGAGDNMICTAVAIEVGKYFAVQRAAGRGLENTRVVVGSWDSEEAGLRGARAYVKQHRSDLIDLKTYNFNLECLYDHQEMTLLTSDLNSFVPLSKRMAEQCSQIADQLGYQVPPVKFPFMAGGTDAAEFAKAGIEATTLAAMNWEDKGDAPAYHTRRDTIEAVDPIAVERSIDLAIHYVLEKDRENTNATSSP